MRGLYCRSRGCASYTAVVAVSKARHRRLARSAICAPRCSPCLMILWLSTRSVEAPIGGARAEHLARVSVGHPVTAASQIVKGRDPNRLNIMNSGPERRLLSVGLPRDARRRPRSPSTEGHE